MLYESARHAELWRAVETAECQKTTREYLQAMMQILQKLLNVECASIFLQQTFSPTTLEYVAIPLGSSSAAPVTNPGPNILSVFRNQLADGEEVSMTVTLAKPSILGSTPIGPLVAASERSFPSGDRFTRSVRIERADLSYLFDYHTQ